MSRYKQVAKIYGEVEEAHEEIMRKNPDDKEMIKIITLVDISQSLKNIDVTLALLYDKEVGEQDG